MNQLKVIKRSFLGRFKSFGEARPMKLPPTIIDDLEGCFRSCEKQNGSFADAQFYTICDFTVGSYCSLNSASRWILIILIFFNLTGWSLSLISSMSFSSNQNPKTFTLRISIINLSKNTVDTVFIKKKTTLDPDLKVV